MKRVWDAILGIIVTLFAVKMILSMLQPYALHIIVTVVVVMLVGQGYRRSRRW